MSINLQELAKVSRGDPDTQISVTKKWMGEVILMLERLSRDNPYDTSALRTMATTGSNPKLVVQRRWLKHIHETITRLERHARVHAAATQGLVQKGQMTPEAQRDFDAAFSSMNTAFAFMDRGLSKMKWR